MIMAHGSVLPVFCVVRVLACVCVCACACRMFDPHLTEVTIDAGKQHRVELKTCEGTVSACCIILAAAAEHAQHYFCGAVLCFAVCAVLCLFLLLCCY